MVMDVNISKTVKPLNCTATVVYLWTHYISHTQTTDQALFMNVLQLCF